MKFKKDGNGCSFTAMSRSPVNIARLMGYEVVDEERTNDTVTGIQDEKPQFAKYQPGFGTPTPIYADWYDRLGNLEFNYHPVDDSTAWYRAKDVWACIEPKLTPVVNQAVVKKCFTCAHRDEDPEDPESTCMKCRISVDGGTKWEKKEADMEKRKPHKDWTLGEVQRYCAARNGNCSDDCAFSRKGVGFVCKVALKPRDWGLSTPPRFTEEEVADARAIVKLLPYPELTLCRENGGSLWLESTAMSYLHLSGNAFPSILPGTSVSLKEIASETE